ncbi:MAG: type II secretion system protein GspL [Sphingomonadaceae bacterium]
MTLLLATEDGVETLASGAPDSPIIGVIPGDDVALHRIDLLETTPARRRAEAHMRATDLAARPLDELHLALADSGHGDAEGGGCWLAIIDPEQIQAHLAHFQAAGVEPAHIVPAAMLLPEAHHEKTSTATLGGLTLVRGADFAAAMEPALAAAIGNDAAPSQFEPRHPAQPPLDLRQGPFAPKVRWWRLGWVRVLVPILLLLALLLALAPLLITQGRAAAIAAAEDAAIIELAERALGQRPDDAATAVAALSSARIAAEGSAITPRIGFAGHSLATTTGARLDSVALDDGELLLTLAGNANAINAASAKLLDGPFAASADGATVTLGQRRPPVDRVAAAQADAAILIAHRRTAVVAENATPASIATAVLVKAGLADTATLTATDTRVTLDIPAARSAILLPLVADIEAANGRLVELYIGRNQDETLNSRLEISR